MAVASEDILIRLSLLLQLQRRLRHAEVQERGFIAVNEVRVLVPYRQAVLWLQKPDGSWYVNSVSGLAVPDAGAPFVLWLEQFAKAICCLPDHVGSISLSADILPDALAAEWSEWLPECGRWYPLYSNQKKLVGALCYFREIPFRADEVELLGHFVETCGLCVQAELLRFTSRNKYFSRISLHNWRVWLAVFMLIVAIFPVRQSVLVPAEVTSQQPAHIRAPLDGVVASLLVEPNQPVAAGQPLALLEDDQLHTRLLVAEKNLAMANAELQQAQQLSLVDPRHKLKLPLLHGRVEQLAAEVDYVQTQLARVKVVSPSDGIAVFDDPDSWAGRPVRIGQKILEVADPEKVMLEIHLPMTEAVSLHQNDKILFFPNISPHSPLSGKLIYIGYQASETPEAGIAFTLRADFTVDSALPRLGMRGTAKLYGRYAPLVSLLLRKPLLQLRQWVGV